LINIRRAEFAEIEKLWRERLWPQRKSAIEPNSAMILGGGIDLSYMNEEPQFWIAEDLREDLRTDSQDESQGESPERPRAIGCLSGHFAGEFTDRNRPGRLYRSRGLWVDQSRRRRGIARQLMRELIEHARSQDAVAIWTFPRKTAMPFYESMGFRMWSTWLPQQEGDSDLNCYAILELEAAKSSESSSR